MTRAARLNAEGQFRAALELIGPLVDGGEATSADPIIGIAWNIRGLSLQSLGDKDQARRSYDEAIRILRGAPAWQVQYASALDNLGSLEADAGHFVESRSLRLRAEEVYTSVGDRAGVARTLNNLALVAMAQRNWKEARRDLADGFEAEGQRAKPDNDDVAALYMAKSLEEGHERNNRVALAAVGKAIDLWIEEHGPEYYLLADGYSMRGRVNEVLHDYQGAIGDFEHSLNLMRQNRQDRFRAYAMTEVAYARALRDAGRKDEAAQADAAAQSVLSGATGRQCRGCTISVESLR